VATSDERRERNHTCPITASPTSPTVEVIVPGALQPNRCTHGRVQESMASSA